MFVDRFICRLLKFVPKVRGARCEVRVVQGLTRAILRALFSYAPRPTPHALFLVVSFSILHSLLSTQKAFAAPPAANPCDLIGAGCTSSINVVYNFIPLIGSTFVSFAAAAAVLSVIVAGMYFITAGGDDGKITKAKMAGAFAAIGLVVTFLAQSIVAYVSSRFAGLHMNTDPVFAFMRMAVNTMVTLFNVIFVGALILGGYLMAFSQGSPDQFKKGISILNWGIVGAVVVNVAFAAVNAILNLAL